MNFSMVRVQGVLASDARLLRDGTVLYMVDDGTGTLSAFLGQSPPGNLPKEGSRIAVAGSLSVGAGNNIRMRVRSADDTEIDSGEPPAAFLSDSKLSDLAAGQQGTRMTVCGTVSKVWSPAPGSKAPHKIVLSDPSGSLEVVHWFEPKHAIALGDELEIRGTVDVYKGRLQLKVWEAGDIAVFAR
ncbi:MAG: OB-fold nucleic acid binding domain-containing protein [Kiritimatiellales bacterium]|nr:OB-fold nucleic acid binding domain-containing protein [Kiritimatiellales bacterium]MCF7864218.1 OB-fold nucleic acid binding domain-containing protein [Kiritimatiellales bacterium]